MNSIFKVLKLDHCIVKTSYSKMIMIYFMSILLGLLTQPIMPIILIMFFCVSFSGFAFSIIEKNNCERLYGILPIHKREIITGRYLYGFILGIANLIISIMLAYIIAMFSKQQIDTSALFLSMAFAFFYYCFAVSISYPIYYKIGFSKSYIFITLPLYILILLIVFLSEKTNLLETIGQDLQYFANHYILFLLCGFIFSMLMLIISAIISYFICNKYSAYSSQ
jgi:ABC-2 type transport system permease protein